MTTKQRDAITRHGISLLRAFPHATEQDPVKLCKKLRHIETGIAPIILQNCNVGVPEAEMDAATDRAVSKVAALLGLSPARAVEVGLFVNRDPRGYALKFSSEWTRGYNDAQHRQPDGLPIHSDCGSYGILAPEIGKEG